MVQSNNTEEKNDVPINAITDDGKTALHNAIIALTNQKMMFSGLSRFYQTKEPDLGTFHYIFSICVCKQSYAAVEKLIHLFPKAVHETVFVSSVIGISFSRYRSNTYLPLSNSTDCSSNNR
jgi:hypothetical protein